MTLKQGTHDVDTSGAHPQASAQPAQLTALTQLEFLDSPAEPALDRITRLATTLLHAPIALISFIDSEHQFLKSSVGLPEPWLSLRLLPLSHSFCQHTIKLAEPLIIPDTRNHPLVFENPALLDFQFLAYAGIALRTAAGDTLGTLCVIDTQPHLWSTSEITHLHDLAALVATEIALHSATRQTHAPLRRTQRSTGQRSGAQRTNAQLRADLALLWRNVEELQAHEAQARAANEKRYQSLLATAQRQAQELELLDRVRTALASEIDIPGIIRTVVNSIVETFGYTLVSLYLRQGDELILQYQIGYAGTITHIPITAGVAGRVARTGEAVLIEDVQADPAFLGAIAGILSEVCVPLHDQGRVVGILNVESTNEVMLTHADLNLMLAVSSHVTIALGRARIYQEMRERQEHFATIFRASPVTISITERLTGRFLDVNDRFLALMGYARAEVIDRTALELNAWADPADRARVGQALLKDRSIHGMEITFRTKSGSMLDTLASFELITLNGVECILSLTQDITQRKRAEADRDRLIAELTSALANIKVLRGLVPICASCKKIRDDDGFWNQFESYIQAHTEAQFSHGICPDCVRRLYPDFSDDET